MLKKRQKRHSNISLRLPGKMPLGRFDFTCSCGEVSGRRLICSSDAVYKCKKCGAEYKIVKQNSHFHIFITFN